MATVTQSIPVQELVPFNVNIPLASKVDGTNNPVFSQGFSDGTPAVDEVLFTERVFMANYGASNPNITAVIDWYALAGSIVGAVVWGMAMQAVTPGDPQSLETDGFATEVTGTTTVNGTAKGLTRTTIVINQLDGVAPGDSVVFRITRRQSNGADTMSGRANLVGLTIQYPDV